MLDRTLYVGLSRLSPGVLPAALAPHLEAHLRFMIGLEEGGALFASGPFFAGGASTGCGLTIVRAASLAEAREILDRDPFAVAGLRTWELHEWHVMEGAIHVTLHASRQRGSLP
jgi:uncharacterized protein YciI